MRRKLTAVLLLSILVIYIFNPTSILLNYIVDIKAYTVAYCENIDHPEMECHGKCHLRYELAQNTDDNKHHNEIQVISEIIIFMVPRRINVYLFMPLEKHLPILFYSTFLSNGFIGSILHPPQIHVDSHDI